MDKWLVNNKHSIRREAVRRLTLLVRMTEGTNDAKAWATNLKRLGNQSLLGKLAIRKREHVDVRRAAIGGLDDQSLLSNIVRNDESPEIQSCALQRLSDPLLLSQLAREHKDIRLRVASARRIEDQSVLRQLVREADDADVRIAAIEHIRDEALLAQIVQDDEDTRVGVAAVEKIHDPAVITRFATEHNNADISSAAIEQLDDQDTLTHIACEDGRSCVRITAVKELDDESQLLQMARDSDKDVAMAAFIRVKEQIRNRRTAHGSPEYVPNRHILVTRQTEDELLLEDLCFEAQSEAVQHAALETLDREAQLFSIARQHRDESIRCAAVARISVQRMLTEVFENDASNEVRAIATDRLNEVRNRLEEDRKSVLADRHSNPNIYNSKGEVDAYDPSVALRSEPGNIACGCFRCPDLVASLLDKPSDQNYLDTEYYRLKFDYWCRIIREFSDKSALVECILPALEQGREELWDGASTIISSVAYNNQAAVPILVQMLKTQSGDKGKLIVRVLGVNPCREATEALLECLEENRYLETTVKALVNIAAVAKGEPFRDAICESLFRLLCHSTELSTVTSAAEGLRSLAKEDHSRVGLLVRALDEGSRVGADAAAVSLASFPECPVAEALLEYFKNNPDSENAATALRTIAKDAGGSEGLVFG